MRYAIAYATTCAVDWLAMFFVALVSGAPVSESLMAGVWALAGLHAVVLFVAVVAGLTNLWAWAFNGP